MNSTVIVSGLVSATAEVTGGASGITGASPPAGGGLGGIYGGSGKLPTPVPYCCRIPCFDGVVTGPGSNPNCP